MSTLSPPILYSPAEHSHFLPQIAQIHADCVLHDYTLATFLPKNGAMDIDQLLAYWRSRVEQVEQETRFIVMQLVPKDGREGEEEVAGYATLWMPVTETGPFRSEVEKLLVSPRYRRRGVAKAVMRKLEDVAKERGRGLLMLDTEIGSDAEHVYPKLGYKTMGIVPKYGISPKDGRLVDEIWYYKDLRDENS